MRRLLVAFFALFGVGLLALGLAVPLIAQESDQTAKSGFLKFVEDRLSSPGRRISIDGLDGVLSSDVSIKKITISDDQGVWLEIDDAHLIWNQGALLTGRLEIDTLKAARIDYIRPGVTPPGSGAPPSPEATGFSVPELPVAVDIKTLDAPKVSFGAPVFGLSSDISLSGHLRLEGGSLDTALKIKRLDGPGGTLDLDARYANADKTLKLGLDYAEPADGMVANLLKITGRPALGLKLSGSGPVSGFDAELDATANGSTVLSGKARLAQQADGLLVTTSLGGGIASLIPAPYRPFFGTRTALEAKALVKDAGGVRLDGFSLSGGEMNLNASADTTADGFLNKLRLRAEIVNPDGGTVLLPVAGAKTAIASAKAAIDFGDGQNWTGDLTVKGLTLAGGAAQTIRLGLSGAATDLNDAQKRRITFNGDGAVEGIAAKDQSVARVLGTRMGLGLAGLWQADKGLTLAQFRLVGAALQADLTGTLKDLVFNGKADLKTASLAPFSGFAGRPLAGGLSTVARGQVRLSTGGFSLQLAGEGHDLNFGLGAADRLFAGTTTLSGTIGRDMHGLSVKALRLDNAQAAIMADGALSSSSTDFSFSAKINDPGRLAPSPKPLGQALTLEGTAKGKNGAVALEATVRLGSARVDLAGPAMPSPDLKLTVTALPLTLADLVAPQAGVSGLLSGTARVTGSLSAPSVRFDLDASDVSATAIEGLGATPLKISASGQYSGSVLDLAAAEIDGPRGLSATASGRMPLSGSDGALRVKGEVPLALGTLMLADRGTQFSGTLAVDALVRGSLTQPSYAGTLVTNGAQIVDPLSNLRLEKIAARASLDGQSLKLESLDARVATGGRISGSGTLGLDPATGLPADFTIGLHSARYADGTLFVTTASGTLTVKGALMRDPLIGGRVQLEKTEISIPDLGGGAAEALKVKNVGTPRAVAETLSRVAADQPADKGTGRQSVVRLDISVSAPNQIFVRGRGVDAELGGSVRLTGPVTAIRPVGAFNLIRGRLNILNQRIGFTSGRVTLVGDLNPYVSLAASTQVDDTQITISVTGSVSNPDIVLSSSPALPQDEILSLLVFKRGLNTLSPLQLAQLAAAAADLAGGGSNNSLLEGLRQATGLDDLEVVTDQSGNAAVKAGRYLQDNVYLGVEAAADGKSTVSLDLDLGGNVTARGATSTDGSSSVGVYYEKDY